MVISMWISRFFLCTLFLLLHVFVYPKAKPSIVLIIEKYLNKSWYYMETDKAKALYWIDNAIKLTERSSLLQERTRILRNYKLMVLGYYGDLDKWKAVLLELERIANFEPQNYPDDLFKPSIDLQTQWAVYYQHIGYYQKSFEFFQKSDREIQKLSKDSAACSNRFYNTWWLANTYKKAEALDASIGEHLRAIHQFKIYEKHIKTPPNQPFLSKLNLAVGDLCLAKGDASSAYKHYQKALFHLKKFNNSHYAVI
jgi:hypothetical protein